MNQHNVRPKTLPLFLKEIAKHWKIMAKKNRKITKTGFPYLNIKRRFFSFKNNQTIKKTKKKLSLVD